MIAYLIPIDAVNKKAQFEVTDSSQSIDFLQYLDPATIITTELVAVSRPAELLHTFTAQDLLLVNRSLSDSYSGYVNLPLAIGSNLYLSKDVKVVITLDFSKATKQPTELSYYKNVVLNGTNVPFVAKPIVIEQEKEIDTEDYPFLMFMPSSVKWAESYGLNQKFEITGEQLKRSLRDSYTYSLLPTIQSQKVKFSPLQKTTVYLVQK